jgi:AcrR family transcriptional regulator
MVTVKSKRLGREDWIRGALELLSTSGIEKVKIVPLAGKLNVTSGSFYWHFANRGQLYDELLEYWEREMTDKAIEQAKHFAGPPKERILQLMEQVMATGMARYDLAIWHWAQSDEAVATVFQRALDKRFAFAAWMFGQAGFSKIQAETRGRMMVVYMMGESTLIPDTPNKRKKRLKLKHEILTSS